MGDGGHLHVLATFFCRLERFQNKMLKKGTIRTETGIAWAENKVWNDGHFPCRTERRQKVALGCLRLRLLLSQEACHYCSLRRACCMRHRQTNGTE